ncbi:MAG: lysylphosphatidylglycerol synthase domain-containing protein [Bacteroidia bacterium]
MKKPAPTTLTRLSWIIKIAIVIAAAFYIWQKITGRKWLDHFPEFLYNACTRHTVSFLFAFLLVFLNWGMEALKWRYLLHKLVEIKFHSAFKAVLAGVTTGIFTPNRVGEFGGRVFSLPEGYRLKAALLSVAGGMVQLLVTLLAALPVILTQRQIHFFLYQDVRIARIAVLVSVPFLIFAFLYRARWLKPVADYLQVFRIHSFTHWLIIFLISGLRYLVFSFQFYLLLCCFGVGLSPLCAYIGITMTFFSSTVIPTMAFSEILVRGGTSLAFVGIFSDNDIGILSASLVLWIINIALPAMAGSIFVLKMNPFKKSMSA